VSLNNVSQRNQLILPVSICRAPYWYGTWHRYSVSRKIASLLLVSIAIIEKQSEPDLYNSTSTHGNSHSYGTVGRFAAQSGPALWSIREACCASDTIQVDYCLMLADSFVLNKCITASRLLIFGLVACFRGMQKRNGAVPFPVSP